MRRCGCALAVLVLASSQVTAQRPGTEVLLDTAAAHLADLFPRLANVVAEERYEQQIVNPTKRRTLVSDYLVVQLPDSRGLATFRDVFDVDGRPVRDRDERLLKLFVESPRTAAQQAAAIAEESARHNISNIGTISSPFLVMAFLQPAYRPHFRFEPPRSDPKVGADVWSVQFQEFVAPTILKGNGNADVFSRGRIWIEASTGRVLKTELLLGTQSPRVGLTPIEILCTFRYDADLDLVVPTEMREFYPNVRLGDVRGKATYGRFRRFGVSTTEVIGR